MCFDFLYFLYVSIDATCFGHVDHPWALKCMTSDTRETRQAMHYNVTLQTRSCNHRCSGKAVTTVLAYIF
jgi:hypothetical protein